MIRESAEGVRSAALRPWTARAAMSCAPLSANPLTSEATVKRARPVRKTPRRDSRSEMRPPRRRPPPDIITYAVTSHCRSLPSRCRELPMVGRAVLTTEMSRTTRIWAARAIPSRAQDFLGPCSSSVWIAWWWAGAWDIGAPQVGWWRVSGRTGVQGVARADPVLTAWTTAVMARTDSAAPCGSSTSPAWVDSATRVEAVGGQGRHAGPGPRASPRRRGSPRRSPRRAGGCPAS